MKLIKRMFVLLGVLILSGCSLSPTKVADDYFKVLYDSNSYKVELTEDGVRSFLENLNEVIEEMKIVTEPYVTDEQSDSLFGGLKLAITTAIFSIVENEYDFSVQNTEYSLDETRSDDNDQYYDYLITIRLVDKNGKEIIKEVVGEIHLTKINNKWKINRDTLTSFDVS